MTEKPPSPFHFDVSESRDEHDLRVTTVTCHGRLVGETSSILKEALIPLIERGGSILIDCADLSFLDSRGLGTLVGIKVSAVSKGSLKLVHLSPKVQEHLRLTRLDQFLSC